MTTSINKKIAVGAGWMISLRWATRLIDLASLAILARLLLPADFGLVGYAWVFLGILDQLFMFSFSTVLIRDQDATDESYNTVWTLEAMKGLLLSVLLVAGAKPAAVFFSEPKVEGILYWIALVPIMTGLLNVGTVDFQKHLELHKEFYFDVLSRFLGTVTTLVLAFVLRDYWALVYGSIIRVALRLVLSYVMSPYRPRPSLAEFSRVFGFSKWLFVQNLFSGFNQRLPVLVIGRYFNAQALAFFNMAMELSTLATAEFAAPIRRALYPGITKMQGNQTQMARTLIMTLAIIVLFGLPATLGIGLTAPLLIPAFLGSNWDPVIEIVYILSLHCAITMLYPSSHVIYYAQNRPKITACISVLRLCILAPVVILVAPAYGLVGTAWALLGINAFVLVLDYAILLHVFPITLPGVVAAVWRSVGAALLMAVCVTLALESPPTVVGQYPILHLAYCVAIGVISYVTTVCVLWWTSGMPDGAESYVLRMLRRIYSSRRPGGLENQGLS